MADEGRFVIDASVVLKWFREEPDTGKALKLQEQINNGSITAFVPDLLLYEVTNALIRGVGETHENVLLALQLLLDMSWEVVTPKFGLLSSAAVTAESRPKLSVYDAVYVALAIERKAALITADRTIHNAFGEPVTKLL